ncbi:MAG: molecular chaperone TorD family protein [Eggerthellaceae bacterium]|nr:molecular chaperone TorD family protein [Eggerthellaceae bacterium]
MDSSTWQAYADAYAFLGNSLLRPMTQTSAVGLAPEFWGAFPDFGAEAVADAADSLALWAEGRAGDGPEKAAQDAAVEYTALFVGPPSPAAPPWETMNRRDGVSVGFGEATFQMREVMRGLGLELAGPSRQYEDHLGLELLCLSEMCRRRAWALDLADTAREAAVRDGDPAEEALAEGLDDGSVAAFIDGHPLGWIGALEAKVEAARPDGYFVHLLTLARALLTHHRQQLGE